MKNHTKVYLDYFGHEDFLPCEICNSKANDIHHIDCRGMGGSKEKDEIENLMGLCRKCHIHFGDKKQYKDYLIEVHLKKLNEHNTSNCNHR